MNAIISLKPGITGYWQVEGRNKAEYCNGERQKLELEYVAKASLWLDIKILFKTIPAVLKHKGVK
jgi:lipopolysaccharide/colanic/teichoic acid biosynthesis glycosyltransferase